MKEQVNIVAYKFINENKAMQFNFNYLNKDNKYIGFIDIDSIGNIKWEIIDLGYKDYFFNILPYLYVGDINNRTFYESTEPNSLRWTRANIYAVNNNINVKYYEVDDDFQEKKSVSR